MKRVPVNFAVEQAVRKLGIFCASASLALSAVAPAHADLVAASAFNTDWYQPMHKRTFTASNSKVQAELELTEHIFDEGKADTSGKLTIIRNGKRFSADKYESKKDVADIVTVKGPIFAAIGDQDEPAIEIGEQTYQSSDYYEYFWDDAKGKYVKQKPSIELGDIASQPEAKNIQGFSESSSAGLTAALTWQQQFGTFGGSGWHLKITRGKECVFDEDIQPPDLPSEDGRVDKEPECFGPLVSTSISPQNDAVVDLRMTRIVGHARLSCEMIYYYDKVTKKMLLSTHEWGLNSPRLAQIDPCTYAPEIPCNYQIQYVTEDWSLSKPDMGGPIQIWQWDNKVHQLVDITKKYSSDIERHAKAAREQFEKERSYASLLAYCGDMCLLGHQQEMLADLAKLNQATETNDKIIAQLKSAHYM
ncbi:MAG TPA: hypothetical protein V6C76_13795 [Drouetiella sp.]